MASIHIRRSAPTPTHMMVRARLDESLLVHAAVQRVHAVKHPMKAPYPNSIQGCASSTDMTSTETKTALRIILHVDTIDMRPPMVFSTDSK